MMTKGYGRCPSTGAALAGSAPSPDGSRPSAPAANAQRERDLRHWTKWTDGELIDQAAGACQHGPLIDDEIVRDAIRLNVIAPFRQQLAAMHRNGSEFLLAIASRPDITRLFGPHERALFEAARQTFNAAITKAEGHS